MAEPVPLMALRAALGVRLLDPRLLPALAEELLGLGYESPAIIGLASMGTEPFDPRDARATGLLAMQELGIPRMTREEATAVSASLLAELLFAGHITARELTALVAQLLIDADCHVDEDLMALYGNNEAWDQDWAGPNARVDASVRAIAAHLRERFPEMASSPQLPNVLAALNLGKSS
jgi:hypothetical protein